MKLNEWLTEDFITKIDWLNVNETANCGTLYYLLFGLYGSREVNSIIDAIPDAGIVADIINMDLSKKWETIKKIYDLNIDISAKENGTTETTTNDIYGYNGEFTRDYKKVVEYLRNNDYEDLFSLIKNDLDTMSKLNYYKIIVKDIAEYLTTPVYFEEE